MIEKTPARFREFDGGAFGLASKGIRGGEVGMKLRMSWIGAARLLQPDDSLFGARLHHVHLANPEITVPDLGIAGTETDGLLHERDYPVY